MAEKKWKGKKKESNDTGGSFNDFAIVALAGIMIVSFPLLPLLVLLGQNTAATFFEIWRGPVRTTGIILDALLIGLMIYTIIEIWQIQPHVRLRRMHAQKGDHAKKHAPMFTEQWTKIRMRMTEDTPDHFRLAIIEADALVDEFLRYVGYEGEHMADRLSKLSAAHIKSLNDVWNAHRLRNILVHSPSATVTSREAKVVIAAYEAFLKEMGGIE